MQKIIVKKEKQLFRSFLNFIKVILLNNW